MIKQALSACALMISVSAAAEPLSVKSPDGRVRFELKEAAGGLAFSVTKGRAPVIEASPLGVTIDGKSLTDGAKFGGAKRTEKRETYAMNGAHAVATNWFNGAAAEVTNGAGGFVFEVRAFNDGVAFRHTIPDPKPASVLSSAGHVRTPDESTTFAIPDGSSVWHHALGGHYEDVYTNSAAGAIKEGEWLAPPVTFKLASGGYASITESSLRNYSGMALRAEGGRKFSVGLGHKHPISYPYRLRYSNDIDRVQIPAAINGTIVSPWRVVMVANDLNALVNSDLVSNLADAPDRELYPKGAETEWIKPGRAVWKYLDGGANTFEDMKRFSEWAGQLGFEYNVLEGFWSRWSDEQLKEFVEFSRGRHVGVWVWRHSRELRTYDQMEAFFDKLARAGVVGAKIDFFDHEHRDVVALYEALLTAAAKRKILVNFHGANKPTGEGRTFPNELTREGVRGMESSRLKERAIHNTTLPFTRFLAGPADYTPVHFGARKGDTTDAHQVATAAIFGGPLLTYAAHPTNLLNHVALPLIKSIPPVWDETRVLEGSEIGEAAIFARRSGKIWFLAILNGPKERSVEVALDFLGRGERRGLAFSDSKLEEIQVRGGRKLRLNLPAGGGYVARFD